MSSLKLILQTFVTILFLIAFTLTSHAEPLVQFSWVVLTDTPTGLQPLDFARAIR